MWNHISPAKSSSNLYFLLGLSPVSLKKKSHVLAGTFSLVSLDNTAPCLSMDATFYWKQGLARMSLSIAPIEY